MKKTLASIALLIVAIFAASAANPLETLGGIVTNLTSTSKFELSSLEGTWTYQSPAVSFKSDQALNKIGGVAASAAVEDKLKTYYDRLGINSLVLTVDADANFTMKIKSATLSGTISKDADSGELVFAFSAFGKKSLGKISAMASKSATGVLTLTFDVTRAVEIAKKVASVANMSTITAATKMLDSYDGIYAGAKFTKQGSAAVESSSQTTNSQSTDATNVGNAVTDKLQNFLNKKTGSK